MVHCSTAAAPQHCKVKEMRASLQRWKWLKKTVVLSRFGLKAVLLVVSMLGSAIFAGHASNRSSWPKILASIRSSFPDVNQLSTAELAKMLAIADKESAPAPLILDTRGPEEFQVSHLGNAIQADSYDKAAQVIKRAGGSKTVVLYCSVGYRSSQIGQQLVRAGFPNVYNLEGSIFKWANEGRPLVGPDGPTTNVHPFNRKWGKLLDER